MSDELAIGQDGRPLPMGPAEVRGYMDAILADPTSTILFIGVQRGDEVAVPVFGPPSADTLAVLKDLIRAYETAITKGHA